MEGLAFVAVGAFATLAVVSAAWSARPEHTEKRALGFLILVLAGAALADANSNPSGTPPRTNPYFAAVACPSAEPFRDVSVT